VEKLTMNCICGRVCPAALAAGVVLVLSLTAQPFAALTGAAQSRGEWKSLFNGTDLTGWTNIGNQKWEVENGTLHGLAVTQDYGYLQTDKSYKDFQLALRFKCEGDGNSGVFFHVRFKEGTAGVTKGPQFEIDCTLGRHTGGVYEQKRHWIVWPSPENESVVRRDDWNDYLLTVEGNHYTSRLNGVLMIDYTDPMPESDDGPLALQLHSGGRGNMRFKDIIIRDLSKRETK
jgi:hypothetical protein